MANKTDQTDIRKYFAAGTRSVVLHIFIPLTNISIRRNKLGLKQFLNLPARKLNILAQAMIEVLIIQYIVLYNQITEYSCLLVEQETPWESLQNSLTRPGDIWQDQTIANCL